MRSHALAWMTAALAVALAGSVEAQQSPAPSGGGQAGESLGKKVEGELGRAAGAQSGAAQPGGTAASLLGWLHQTNATAIQGGKLAQQKGSSSAVRQLGSKLVSDHASLDKEVLALAAAQGLKLPGAGGAAGAVSGLAALQKLKGSAFDDAFLSWVSKSQTQNAAQARSAQAQAQDSGSPGVAALLGKLVPQLESHAQSAQAAQPTSPAQGQAQTGSAGAAPAGPGSGR